MCYLSTTNTLFVYGRMLIWNKLLNLKYVYNGLQINVIHISVPDTARKNYSLTYKIYDVYICSYKWAVENILNM